MKHLNRLLIIALAMTSATLMTGDYVFDRIQPLIYLRSQSKVSLGVAEYDLNFAYANPCKIFEQNVKTHLPAGSELTKDQAESLRAFTTNCNGLYELEWAKEIRQLLRVELPRFPSEFKSPPTPGPYREPRQKRETGMISMRDLTNDEREDLIFMIKEAKILSKLDQLFTLNLHINEPDVFQGTEAGKRSKRSVNHAKSPLHDEDVSDALVFTMDETEAFKADPSKHKGALRNATLRYYAEKERNYTRAINTFLKTSAGPVFLKTILNPSDYARHSYQRNNKTTLSTMKTLETNIGIRHDLARQLSRDAVQSHLKALNSVKKQYPNVQELDDLINAIESQGSFSQISVNDINMFTLYEKIRYFYVPFLEHPEMEERILGEFDRRLGLTTNQTNPHRKPRGAPDLIEDYSVYDAFNETTWDNDDWLNEPIPSQWFTNECGLESAVSARLKAYAMRLGRLNEALKKLSVNELFILRIGNLNRISKREVPQDQWNWWSYLTVACMLWTYPFVCDVEKQYHWMNVADHYKKEIRTILYQPAIEQLLLSSSQEWTLPDEPQYNLRPKRQTSEFGMIDSEMDQMPRSPTTFDAPRDPRIALMSVSELARPKRNGILSEMVSQITTQAIGVITGNIVTNLVTAAIEIINPYSNTNRIARLETAYQEMKSNFDQVKQINRGILDNLDKLSNVVQETVERLDEHVKHFPEWTWLSSLIVNRMTNAALDLQRVTDEARRGRIAVEPFARLTGIEALRNVDSLDTKLVSISRLNDHAINFKFRVMVEAQDTHVERVRTFKYWDNLDDVPKLLGYNGAEYIIRNETSNCVKAISGPPDRYVSDQCIEQDGEDPALSQWNILDQTEELSKYENDSQVFKTMSYNYVYCFPGSIKIERQTYRCPPDAFRLKPKLEFQTAKQKHTPTKVAIETSQDMAIEMVHAGHFPDDSDVVQRLALFDSLRAERKKRREQTEEINNSITIPKHGGLFWSFMTFLIATMAGTAAYVGCVCYLRLKKVRPSRPSAAPPTPHNPPTSQFAYPNTQSVAYTTNRLGEETAFIR